MDEIIKNLYPMNRCLLGEGYDSALEYLKHLLPLEVIEIPSGTKLETWTVPDEWIIRGGTVKDPDGNVIIDYKEDPMSIVVGSLPFSGKVSLDELKKHLHYSDDMPNSTPYVFKYYDKDWGVCMSKNKARAKIEEVCENGVCVPELKDFDSTVGKIQIEGTDYTPKFTDRLKEGEYEVNIDTEYKTGTMKIAVHTIPGKSTREILMFAHLDHPFQANDNLSAVACLVDLASKIKSNYTVKIIFCPETIGSIAYAKTQDISNVEFMLAVDICGNDNSLLFQKSFNPEDKINRITGLALNSVGETYRKAIFRSTIGSDEYVFNDPEINIPGIMLSRHPYKEYHTSDDTPDKISYEQIEKTQKTILKILELYDLDFVPVRHFKGPLMRSKYNMQTENKQVNMAWDYLIYDINGKNSLSLLCSDYGINFELALEVFKKLENDRLISRLDVSEVKKQSTPRKKRKAV